MEKYSPARFSLQLRWPGISIYLFFSLKKAVIIPEIKRSFNRELYLRLQVVTKSKCRDRKQTGETFGFSILDSQNTRYTRIYRKTNLAVLALELL